MGRTVPQAPPADALQEALGFLFRGLTEAKKRFEEADNSGRDGVIDAVETILKFLLFLQSNGLEAPFARLCADLMALDDGEVSPLLAPKKKAGRARANALYDGLKGVAVFTVRRLAATGIGIRDARRMVANELARCGVRPARKGAKNAAHTPEAGRFSERTLRKWQEDIGINKTAADTLRQLEDAWQEEQLKIGSTDLRRLLLERLAAFVTAIRAAEKPPNPDF
jgi:hypothetical protein